MNAPSDFRLYHGNSLDVLAGLLAAELGVPAPGASLLEQDTILIPQASMRRWLQNALAEAHGIAANLRFLTPGEFVRDALRANLAGAEDVGSFDAATMRWRLYGQLREASTLRHPALAELANYLRSDDPLKPWSLAGELAGVFEKYQAWRRDWLLRWEAGSMPDDWQAELWRRVAGGKPHRARRIAEYLARHADGDFAPPIGLPSRLFAFACINVSPDVLRVIATQARAGTLHFYLPTPCRNYWGDLRSLSERLRDGDDDSAFAVEENPLLEAWGRAGRDVIATLAGYDVVHPSGEIAAYADPETDSRDEPERDTLLRRLQRDLLHRRAPPQSAWRAQVDRGDASVQIHACHTRLREVQVLHDQLRALLESDPTLEPRDIAVLAPDIDLYLPHIESVFGGAATMDATHAAGHASLYLPYAIADGSPLAAEPLAGVFLRLLALPQSRFGVNEVLDLLAVPAIAERFDVAPDALDTLRHWLGEAGARWGLDAAHRARLGAPADAAFTWRFALDRLLLGYAADDEAPIAGVAPWTELEGGALVALDALIQLLRLLARHEQMFAESQPPHVWQQRLLHLLEAIAPEHPSERSDQRALERLREALEKFRAQADAAGFDAPIPLDIVRAWFQDVLSEADTRAPSLPGGITFCRMVPMRLIPFRVICLLGMNDGEVPRRDPAGALNRLAAALGTHERRRGDRSLRDDDRFLFLQLLAAAGDTFYLSYIGADPRDGSVREPSVLVGELLDTLARYHAQPQDSTQPDPRRQLVVHHPQQPFAPQAFGAAARDETAPEPRRFSYRGEWSASAAAAQGERIVLPPFSSTALAERVVDPAANDDPRTIELRSLRDFLRDPPRAFLRQRLDLHLPDSADLLPEVEPFETPEGLRRHALRQAVFAACMDVDGAPDIEALHTHLVARALLPSGPQGALQLRKTLDDVRAYADTCAGWRGAAAPTTLAFALDLDDWRLQGVLADVYPHGLARQRFGKLDGRSQIDHGLDWLVLSALDDTRPLVQFAEFDDGVGLRERASLSMQQARRALQWLLALREDGLRTPLQFLPRSGWDAYTTTDDDKAWNAAAKHWTGSNGQSWAEGDTDATRLALRARDPFAPDAPDTRSQFLALSRRVFDALLLGDVDCARADGDRA
jgi:exodeoxyribonuclease V gamma subunit